jgi:hypothetical protein
VLSPQLAYLLTHVMSDETARWPSLKHPNPLKSAGQPGPSGSDRRNGAWVMGFTSNRHWCVVGTTNRPDRLAESAGGEPESTEFESDLTLVTSASKRNEQCSCFMACNTIYQPVSPAANWSAPPGISSIDVRTLRNAAHRDLPKHCQ